jgi:hypothetical protein
MARQGKIARLPSAVRAALNARILEGQHAGKILPWINGLPEVHTILEELFAGEPVTDQNLSNWRLGGYAEWQQRRERIDETRELAKFAADLARSKGGTLSDAGAAILAGKLLGTIEGLASAVDDPEKLSLIAGALATLRAGDHTAEKIRQMQVKLGQAAEMIALERHKFQRQTCGLFLKWAEEQRATEILAGPGTNAEKIERLGKLMFDEDWE